MHEKPYSQNDILLEIVRTISASPLELSAETILKKILMDSYQPDFLEIFEINPKAKEQELHLEEKTEIVEETRFEINRLVERITASGKPEISTLKSSNTKLLIGIPVNWSPIKYIVVAMIANDNNTFSRVQQDEFINFLRFLEYLLRQKTEANQLLRQNRQLTEVAEQRHRELEQVKNELKSNLEKLDHDRLTALKKYEQIFDKSLNAFALHEIIVDETHKPIDYRFLDVNRAFEFLTGLKAAEIINKRVTQILPGIEKSGLIEKYGEVALTSQPVRFEQYAEQLNKYYDISAFAPCPGQFITIFTEITVQKLTEKREAHLKSVLKSMRKVNHLIASSNQIRQMLQGICDILVADRGYRHAWFNIDTTQSKTRTWITAGLNQTAVTKIAQLKDNQLPNCALRAHNSRKVQIIRNTKSDCRNCPLEAEYPDLSSITAPLFYNEQLYGTISVSLPPDLALDNEEQLLFQELAEDVAFGIYGLELNEKRKLIEGNLQESEEIFRSITNSAQDAIIMIDHNDKTVFWNPAAEKMFGYTKEEIIGKSLHSILAPQRFHAAHHAGFQAFKKTGTGAAVGKILELAALKKNGAEFPVELSLSAVKIKNKWNAIGIIRDISKRNQAMDALKESKEYAEQLYRMVPSAIFTVDTQGRLTNLNDKAVEILGYSHKELIGQTCSHFVQTPCSEHNSLFTQPNPQSIHGKECSIRRKDGEIRYISKNAEVIRNAQGEIIGGIESFEDITERKKYEESLKIAKEAAENANHSKSEFLANMSHEIRTPMNGIIGLTELTLETNLAPIQRQYLGIVKNSADQLLSLLNDILDFSKIEAGQLDLEQINYDLIKTVEAATDIVLHKSHEKGLELNLYINPNVPAYLIGDPGRLKQILVNLLGNSIKFTENGEITVRVTCEQKSQTEATIHFAVSDTGIGIPEDRQQAIFESFTQADTSTTRKFGGTGLGLAISKQLVNKMGGTIWLESKIGVGSTFYFTIKSLVQKKRPRTKTSLPLDIRGIEILVVDDNETNRFILQEILKNFKCPTVLTSSVEEALAILNNSNKIQLIITDYQMPNEDGLTLFSKVRALEKYKEMPIILLSSVGKNREVYKLEKEKNFWAIQKPVKQSQLLDTMMVAMADDKSDFKVPLKFNMITKTENRFFEKLIELHPDIPILLAEDNIVNQKVAKALLERVGLAVEIADDGAQALTALKQKKYTLVLMDVQMPNMDGFTATQKIRSELALGHLPIIAMTAHAMKGDKEKCLAAGMNDYISKPISPGELYRVLYKWLTLKSGSVEK